MFSLSCLGGPWSCEAYWTALFFTPLLFSICLSILPPDLTSAVPLLHVSRLFLLCHSMTFCSSTLFLYYLLPFLPQLPQYICLPFILQPRVSWLVFLLPSCFTFWLVRSCWLSLPLYPRPSCPHEVTIGHMLVTGSKPIRLINTHSPVNVLPTPS